uniref:Uncharacterized protein n=1 Tax=Chelonoidis abingdonii TaxID=106734 RepID=A0A8C0G4X4_CHEAB
MSNLIKAIADMIDSYQGNSRKGRESERFRRCEFKKLVQQEPSPAKRSSSSKYKHTVSLPDSDAEPMNKKELITANPCVY